MKQFVIIVTVILCLGCGIIGWSQRGSYTNITNEDNFMEQFSVAILPDDLASDLTDIWREELPKANIILRVKALGEIDYLFNINVQRVEVLEVYKGEEVHVGNKIGVTSTSWRFFFDDMTANLNFVNFMEKENEYLIFLDKKMDSLNPSDQVYRIWDEFLMFPIFNYENKEHVFIEPTGETLNVPYSEVSQNEFMVSSQERLEKLNALKEYLFERYPQ